MSDDEVRADGGPGFTAIKALRPSGCRNRRTRTGPPTQSWLLPYSLVRHRRLHTSGRWNCSPRTNLATRYVSDRDLVILDFTTGSIDRRGGRWSPMSRVASRARLRWLPPVVDNPGDRFPLGVHRESRIGVTESLRLYGVPLLSWPGRTVPSSPIRFQPDQRGSAPVSPDARCSQRSEQSERFIPAAQSTQQSRTEFAVATPRST